MRTVLTPLRLEGVGTSAVESLVSYTLRLADAHAVSANQIGKVLFNDVPYLHVDGGPKLADGNLDYALLCSFSSQATVMIHRLGRLTGQTNLACGTLLRFQTCLCGNHTGVLFQHRRWCPVCYSLPQTGSYEPLAWCVPLVLRCPHHGVELASSCPYCGARQMLWTRLEQRRICVKCGRPLANSRESKHELDHWSGWCEIEMLKLLEHIATPAAPEFVDDAYIAFAQSIKEIEAGGVRFPDGIEQLRRDIRKGRVVKPRMKTLFNVAAVCGTTPMDILLRPREAASVLLFGDEIALPPAPTKNKFRAENYARCERTFRELLALSDDVLLPPGSCLCERHEVSTSNFWKTRGELWGAYRDERKKRLDNRADERLSVAVTYAGAAIQRALSAGSIVHRKKAVAQMQKDVGISKQMARSALRVALMQARLDKRPCT